MSCALIAAGALWIGVVIGIVAMIGYIAKS
jgi:hypothetical protein